MLLEMLDVLLYALGVFFKLANRCFKGFNCAIMLSFLNMVSEFCGVSGNSTFGGCDEHGKGST